MYWNWWARDELSLWRILVIFLFDFIFYKNKIKSKYIYFWNHCSNRTQPHDLAMRIENFWCVRVGVFFVFVEKFWILIIALEHRPDTRAAYLGESKHKYRPLKSLVAYYSYSSRSPALICSCF